MNTLDIENLFADVLGIRLNTRGDVNDADAINFGGADDLMRAVRKALKVLKGRAKNLPNDGSNLTVNTIGRLEMTIDSIESNKEDIVGLTKFHLWSLFAISLDLVHRELKSEGL